MTTMVMDAPVMVMIEKTKVQIAEENLSAFESRKAEILSRIEAINDDRAAKRDDLGLARLNGDPTKEIHQEMVQLGNEKAELEEAVKAIQPIIEKAGRDLQQAQAEAAVEEYRGLAELVARQSVDLYQELDLLHIQLCELGEHQRRMVELEKVAGKLLPAFPTTALYIPVDKTWGLVDRAIDSVIYSNVPPYSPDTMALNELKIYDRLKEFAGTIQIER
jgi:hypothetical protein